MPHEAGVSIRRQCSYLKNVLPIGFLTEGRFAEYKEIADEDIPPDSDLSNPFAYWLYEKLSYHRDRDKIDRFTASMLRLLGEPA